MTAAMQGGWSPDGGAVAMGPQVIFADGPLGLAGERLWADSGRNVVVAGDVVLHPSARRRAGLPASLSDGELLAEAIARDGITAIQAMDGAFAVAVWEKAGRLHLVRDHAGHRTLYFAHSGKEWWFASTLAALEGNPAVPRSLSLEALRDYLIYSFVPGEQTMWREISELRPGMILSIPDGSMASYYEPTEVAETGEDLQGYATRLRAALEDGVGSRLSGKEPVGVYLSGGLDSSLITALVARAHEGPVHTYSLHFGAAYRNELEYSDIVAQRYETNHHTLEITPGDVATTLHSTMDALDDPIGDPLTVPNFLMGRAAAADVRVIFNGEGGDPCFGGPKNQPMLLQQVYPSDLSRESAYLRSFQKCYVDLPELLAPWVQEELAGTDPGARLIPLFESDRMSQYLNRLMYINVRLKGADHILTKVQNLTRANGLLAHSPLFDREIVDLSFAIPPRFKLSSTEEKVVLKAAAADIVPEEILRRPKSGMMVPVQGWFRSDLRRLAEETLWAGKSARTWRGLRHRQLRPTQRDAMIWRYLEPEPAQRWLEYEGSDRHGLKLWMLISLEHWLQTHAQRQVLSAAPGRPLLAPQITELVR